MPLNLPNLLTWLRILFIPLMAGVFYLPDGWLTPANANLLAAAFFGIAALTDWFDGYLARALGQTSAFGAFLDPVADKLIVAAALIVLIDLGRVAPLVALIIVTIVVFWRIRPPAGMLLLPYAAWTSFATVLNASIFALNR